MTSYQVIKVISIISGYSVPGLVFMFPQSMFYILLYSVKASVSGMMYMVKYTRKKKNERKINKEIQLHSNLIVDFKECDNFQEWEIISLN
jgi:hypothetical protein